MKELMDQLEICSARLEQSRIRNMRRKLARRYGDDNTTGQKDEAILHDISNSL